MPVYKLREVLVFHSDQTSVFFVKCNSMVHENLLTIDYSKKLNDTVQRKVNK